MGSDVTCAMEVVKSEGSWQCAAVSTYLRLISVPPHLNSHPPDTLHLDWEVEGD